MTRLFGRFLQFWQSALSLLYLSFDVHGTTKQACIVERECVCCKNPYLITERDLLKDEGLCVWCLVPVWEAEAFCALMGNHAEEMVIWK